MHFCGCILVQVSILFCIFNNCVFHYVLLCLLLAEKILNYYHQNYMCRKVNNNLSWNLTDATPSWKAGHSDNEDIALPPRTRSKREPVCNHNRNSLTTVVSYISVQCFTHSWNARRNNDCNSVLPTVFLEASSKISHIISLSNPVFLRIAAFGADGSK